MSFSFKFILKTAAKLLAMGFPMVLALVQIPELKYDMNGNAPITITSLAELNDESIGLSAFAAVEGKGNFDHAFTYASYGIPYSYFMVEPYGLRLVIRTHLKVTDDWRNLSKFVGRMKPYRRLPFSRTVRKIFKQQYDIDIPADAFFLLHEDVPAISGWSVAALAFCVILWLTMGYFFFLWKRPMQKSVSQ